MSVPTYLLFSVILLRLNLKFTARLSWNTCFWCKLNGGKKRAIHVEMLTWVWGGQVPHVALVVQQETAHCSVCGSLRILQLCAGDAPSGGWWWTRRWTLSLQSSWSLYPSCIDSAICDERGIFVWESWTACLFVVTERLSLTPRQSPVWRCPAARCKHNHGISLPFLPGGTPASNPPAAQRDGSRRHRAPGRRTESHISLILFN